MAGAASPLSAAQEGGGWARWLSGGVAELSAARLQRFLHPATFRAESAVKVTLDDAAWRAWLAELEQPEPEEQRGGTAHHLRLFSANDYLGLSTHPEVRQAASQAAAQAGMGVRASPLVAGYSQAHAELERELARLKGAEDCLLFSSGFSANLAVLGALARDPAVDVLSDELNHASIIDGARLAARGRIHTYRHNDLRHLEALLQKLRRPGRRQLVVTDSLFSMDGDFADLKGLAALRGRYGFLLALDEAHATLVCGPSGGGAAEAAGIEGAVDLHIGTLSKAVGSHGGFVACSALTKAWLLNRGRSYVYSTALPAPVVAAATAAIRVARRESWRRRHVWACVARLGAALGVEAQSPIVPIVIGSEAEALRASGELLRRGFHVPAIRPPTVAAGTCRLRVALSAAHSYEDVDALAAAILSLGITPIPLEEVLHRGNVTVSKL